MAKRMSQWLVLVLALGLMITACTDEDPLDENDRTIPAEDRMPPLENLDSLMEGAPKNDDLGAEGKADDVFPTQFDLLDTQSPVRSQGSRGVCSIFSAVALMEHLYIKEGTIAEPNFSEQFLQWSTKVEVGRFQNTDGSNAQVNLQAISDYGVVAEADWPYESSPWGASDDPECTGETSDRPVRCFTNGDPSAETLAAPRYQLPSGRWISTRTQDLKAYMFNNEKAVVVGGTFYYQSWNHGASDLPTNQEYWRNGYVLYPNETDKAASLENRAGHSILLVGWDDELEVERLDGEGNVMLDDDGEPLTEKGFFIFKNSWGTGSFGVDDRDGYGYISYRYVQEKSGRVAGTPEPHHIAEPNTDECATDEDCDGVEICQDNQCVPECVSNDDCASGQACELNQCVATGCDEDNPDCGDPECLGEPVCDGEEEEFYHESFETIPDNDPAGLTTEIVVPGTGLVQGVTVETVIAHSFNGDLRIELIHPNGDSVVLREADGTPGLDIQEEFTTTAFNGLDSEGTWQLKVTDTAAYDEGDLFGWYLRIVR